MIGVTIDAQFWRGRRVLITGHTGFKGAWLSAVLLEAGARVTGFALEPATEPNLFTLLGLEREIDSHVGDVRDLEALRRVVRTAEPEYLFHLAAQALVADGYADPVGTYATNVMGTVNVLEAVRAIDPLRAAVVVSSDKCYENREWVWGYREIERMGGNDPYSSSKGAAELVVHAYRRSFFSSGPAIASARAGNVIGGGDWSKKRLVPDVVRAVLRGSELELRNPTAVRPWQHVLEPLSGYLLLARRAAEDPRAFAEAWNFGPAGMQQITVAEMAARLLTEMGSHTKVKVVDRHEPHEAHLLLLDSAKSRDRLGWRNRMSDEQAIRRTAEWYREWDEGADVRDLTLRQIREYFDA
ncbi:MAG TPA: CDP-glucose 4,6-dehydratase [Candidatus Dormibacteraeota bacterium]|nr:CDP-glucose 4,6-dehydratase [Candidatus Dormibacteraeota bacterium]